ncbi:unnamed protein product [Amoebophrya sp. A25]|nr:unnamed protein product [Amoebophrya sp. A25]|eukprot:GSA25T00020093001.1
MHMPAPTISASSSSPWPPPHLLRWCGGKQASEVVVDELRAGDVFHLSGLRAAVSVRVVRVYQAEYLCEAELLVGSERSEKVAPSSSTEDTSTIKISTPVRTEEGRITTVRLPIALLTKARKSYTARSQKSNLLDPRSATRQRRPKTKDRQPASVTDPLAEESAERASLDDAGGGTVQIPASSEADHEARSLDLERDDETRPRGRRKNELPDETTSETALASARVAASSTTENRGVSTTPASIAPANPNTQTLAGSRSTGTGDPPRQESVKSPTSRRRPTEPLNLSTPPASREHSGAESCQRMNHQDPESNSKNTDLAVTRRTGTNHQQSNIGGRRDSRGNASPAAAAAQAFAFSSQALASSVHAMLSAVGARGSAKNASSSPSGRGSGNGNRGGANPLTSPSRPSSSSSGPGRLPVPAEGAISTSSSAVLGGYAYASTSSSASRQGQPTRGPSSSSNSPSGRRARRRRVSRSRLDELRVDETPISPDIQQTTSFTQSLYNGSQSAKKNQTDDLEALLRQTERDYVWNQLPRTPYIQGGSAPKECVLCLVDFESEDLVVRMPCLHTFHVACVEEWVTTNGTCPTCSLDICSSLH